MPTEPGCWASIVSPCGGGMSCEHVVSRALLEKSVTVRGLHWCEEEFKTVGVESLTAKCLCRDHNSVLSECDQEALRCRDAMRWMMEKRFRRGDGPGRVEQVNGFRFARWMAKTACDVLATGGNYVPPALARYAFAQQDDRAIRVYLYVAHGNALEVNDDHIGIYLVHERENRDGMLVCFLFLGLPWVIGTIDIAGAEPLVSGKFGLPRMEPGGFLQRPNEIALDVPVPGLGMARKGSLRFSW